MSSRALQIVQKHFPKVEKVKEAIGKLLMEVIPEDVAVSKRKDHKGCVMAVACKRNYKLDGVIISLSRAYLIKGKIATRFDVPSAVNKEVISFDRGAGFEPGIYELRKPQHTLEKQGGGKHKVTGTGKKRSYHFTTNVRSILGSDFIR